MCVLSERRGEEKVHGGIDAGEAGHGGEEEGGGEQDHVRSFTQGRVFLKV